jgi:hypothetical protein
MLNNEKLCVHTDVLKKREACEKGVEQLAGKKLDVNSLPHISNHTSSF